MKHIIVMVGPPGSGKSTLAKEYEKNGYVRVSQDDQGRDGHMDLFFTSVYDGKDIVVDRMNFNKEQRDRYLGLAKLKGYSTHIIVKHENYDTCFARMLHREGHPTIKDEKGARGALQTFFTKYERPADDEAGQVSRFYDLHEDTTKKVVVCDLDGTLCNVNHRLHFVKGEGKKDWKGFFSEINNDYINSWCKDVIVGMSKMGYETVFCSGRPDDYKKVTKQWIEKHGLHATNLYMRHRADFRQDSIVKEILLDFEILTRFTPVLFIDDRQQVVDVWRKRGYVCLQCDRGDF